MCSSPCGRHRGLARGLEVTRVMWKLSFLGGMVWACNLEKHLRATTALQTFPVPSGPRGPHGVGVRAVDSGCWGRGQALAGGRPRPGSWLFGRSLAERRGCRSEQWTHLCAKHPAPAPSRRGVSSGVDRRAVSPARPPEPPPSRLEGPHLELVCHPAPTPSSRSGPYVIHLACSPARGTKQAPRMFAEQTGLFKCAPRSPGGQGSLFLIIRASFGNIPLCPSPGAHIVLWETQVPSLGREDPLGEGMATHSRVLAWRIPLTEEPGRLQAKGLQRVGHD